MKNIKIIISESTKKIFNSYRQINKNDPEACGILIGNHKKDEETIYIKIATIPQLKDIRKRNSFKINPAIHQNILAKYFNISNNEDVYLGTWHSHPEDTPNPSYTDIEDWKKQFKANNKLFNKMIFAIVGIKKTKFWLIENGSISIFKEKNIKYDKDS